VTGGARADRVGAKLPSERSRGRSWRGRKPEVAPGSETAWPALHREVQGLPGSTVQGGDSRLGARGGRSIRGCAGEPWWLQKSTRSPAVRKRRRGTCRWKTLRADRVALLDGGTARSVLTVWACRLGRDRGRQRVGLRALCAAENAGAAQRRSGAALLLRIVRDGASGARLKLEARRLTSLHPHRGRREAFERRESSGCSGALPGGRLQRSVRGIFTLAAALARKGDGGRVG
jgi:hypothetical protein